jgi:hypothetical protein
MTERKRWDVVSKILILAIALIVAGCLKNAGKDAAEQILESAKQAKAAADSLAASLKSVASALPEAAKNVDPLKIGQIMDERNSWEDKAKALQEALKEARANNGLINLRDGTAFVEVANPINDFVIQICLDKESNILADYSHRNAGTYQEWSGSDKHGDPVDARTVSLDENLQSIGSHKVIVRISPTGPNNSWATRVYLKHGRTGNADVRVIRVIDLSTSRNPQALRGSFTTVAEFPIHVIFDSAADSLAK